MTQKERPRHKSGGWKWPKGAAQDPELLWDIPAGDEAEKIDELPAISPGFMTDVPWGDVLFQDAGEENLRDGGEVKDGGGTTREHGRTSSDGRCLINAVFAFQVYQRRASGNYQEIRLYRWQRLQPEVGVPWNARLGARISVREALPMPGTATVTVTRTGPGLTISDPTRTATAASVEELRAVFARLPEITIDPPAINPGDSPLAETITAIVTWTPDQGEPCQRMVEPVTVRWYRGRRFKIVLPDTVGSRRQTHARTGLGVVPRDKGEGLKFVVPTEIFWAVDNPEGCCGGGTGYTVIQFVRHMWRLNEDPPKEGRDDFTLDILDSEVERANENPPQDYDPTFTHNPRGTDPAADPIIYPSPDGYGKTAIVQIDEPGLPEALYNRFLENGGVFAWQFVSLLVCVLEDSTGASYLASGLVEQEMKWTLQLEFPGGGIAPTVKSRIRAGFPRKHRTCKPLAEVLDGLELENAYSHPRGHEIQIQAP